MPGLFGNLMNVQALNAQGLVTDPVTVSPQVSAVWALVSKMTVADMEAFRMIRRLAVEHPHAIVLGAVMEQMALSSPGDYGRIVVALESRGGMGSLDRDERERAVTAAAEIIRDLQRDVQRRAAPSEDASHKASKILRELMR